MKIPKTKFLVAGLLAGTLTFVGCKSDTSAERTAEPTDTTTEDTEAAPGTGGSGPSKTKTSDFNIRMPYEDPLRLSEEERSREAEAEAEPGVHEDATRDPGVGGSGVGGSSVEDVTEEDDLNEGGNIIDHRRIPDSPADVVPDEGMTNETDLPEGAR
jgi:hypothetical protein